MAFNCCIACSRLFLAVSSIKVATLRLCLFTVTLKEHHGVWRLRHLVTHLNLLNLLLLSSRPLKNPPRSLDFNDFSFSFFSFSSSSFFLIVSASNSFFFSSFSWSNLALYAECAKRTDFLISLVTGIFSGLQFTGSWNFTASFRSRKPTMVYSPNLDLSFVTTLAFTERLRSESAFAWAKTRHDLARQGSS